MPTKARRRLTLILVVALSFSTSSPSFSANKSIEGSPCKKVGLSQSFLAKNYICSSVSKKLVWKLKQEPKIVAPIGPTWAQIDAEKAAAQAKAAEELRLNQEAEARSQAETKAKIEAEAQAAADAKAKQDAEDLKKDKPVIKGLIIGNLLWGDDFKGSKGSTINFNFWTTRNCHRVPTMGGGACFNDEVQYYLTDAVELDGSVEGAAIITTKRPSSSAPLGACLTRTCPFSSGRFDTHGKVSFQYGFIEARIKMPAGSGNHPAFWMLGDNINQVGWPTTGEIDITEIHSNDPNFTTAAINYSTEYAPDGCCGNHRYTVSALNVGVDVSSGYHTYAVAWLPDSVSFYVDNRLISVTTPQTLGGYWSFNDKFFLILNNAVNSVFSGSWDNLQSSTMAIDWVRSYQINGQGQVFIK